MASLRQEWRGGSSSSANASSNPEVLANVDWPEQRCERERTAVAIGRLKAVGGVPARAVLPRDDVPLDPMTHGAAALAVQQERLLRFSIGALEPSEWRASLELAGRMLAAHGPKTVVAPPNSEGFLVEVQSVAQDSLNEVVRRRERLKQDGLVDRAVWQHLSGPGDAALSGPERLLRQLRADVDGLDELRRVVALHAERRELEQVLGRLGDLARNEVVQGPFLSGGDIARFLAATESASGDLNHYENLGKFIYHVAALADVLSPGGPRLAAAGLLPSPAIVTANRPDVLRVLVNQREDMVDRLIAQGDPAQAAREGAVILRFPIRAEYLGKFREEPTPSAAKLQLLEDAAVRPRELELLAHREWVRIADESFLAAYRGLLIDSPAS